MDFSNLLSLAAAFSAPLADDGVGQQSAKNAELPRPRDPENGFSPQKNTLLKILTPLVNSIVNFRVIICGVPQTAKEFIFIQEKEAKKHNIH